MTREELARECLRIEKEGGDVLGYIEVNMPSYTPRAAWYNLQKQFTGRRGSMLTDGRPKEKPGKENRELGKSKQKLSEVIETLLEGVRAGNEPWKVLTAMGYTNPIAAMKNAKVWCRVNAPELMPELERIVLHDPSKKPRRSSKEAPEVTPVETPADEQSAAETVEFGGKTYEKVEPEKLTNPPWPKSMDKKIDNVTAYVETGDHVSAEKYRETIKMERKKPEGTHTAMIADEINSWNGPTKPLKIRAVDSNAYQTARYENSSPSSGSVPYMTFAWHDSVKGPCELQLAVSTWKRLISEIPVALKQLGLD